MAAEQAPAGWYDDPENPGAQRYWDGANWAPVTPPPPPQEPPREPSTTVNVGTQLPPAPGTNGFAVASLVLGILWIWWIGSILAVIFGHLAKKELSRPGNTQTGSGLATAGLILGYIGLATLAMFAILIAAAATTSS